MRVDHVGRKLVNLYRVKVATRSSNSYRHIRKLATICTKLAFNTPVVALAGLEVWDDEAKDWYSCPPVEGAYVVNMGNLFEQWNNDVYIFNLHRVINRSDIERYSLPFNYNGNPDFIIKYLDKCRDRPDDEKYAPFSVEDYVVQKYKDVYSRVGVYKEETFARPKAAAA
ncbi:hypothetical protein PWT90_00437 [Aphanocladium album]|nr:hypothetical protein PWT90_00437 [Aphanocladium album]